MTADETGKRYVYDAWGRLVTVKDSTGSTTLEADSYDGLGRQVVTTAGGTTTNRYYSAQWQVLEEQVGGADVARYVWSPVYVDAMVLRDRATTTPGTIDERLWPQQNANWDVTAIANGSGVVVERYAYDMFGPTSIYDVSYATTRASSLYSWSHFFQGALTDNVNGFHSFRNRQESPSLSRWLTNDPLGFVDSANLYISDNNNPVNVTDPSGTKGILPAVPIPSLPSSLFAWRYTLAEGPFDIEGDLGYRVVINMYLPGDRRSRPVKQTQMWQISTRDIFGVKANGKIEIRHTVVTDVVDIGRRDKIEDTIGTDEADDYCLYVLLVDKVQGFNDLNVTLPQDTNVINPTPEYLAKLKKMSGPTGHIKYSYIYYSNRAMMNQFPGSALFLPIGDGRGEILTIQHIGTWSATKP
jgi:RHS repeat-associated protein